MSPTPHPKTLLFLGATGGVGLSTLRRSLLAGHVCIALVRTPSRLTALLSTLASSPNLHLIPGNAHSPTLTQALVKDGKVVDMVITSIGGKPDFKTMSIDDPTVCEVGMRTLLQALATVRKGEGVRIVVLSTTGITELGRDVPLLFVPLYHVLLKNPHKDKKVLEDLVSRSGESFTIVRPSLLTDGREDGGVVRVGVEDVLGKTVESKAVGYTISREDVGKWIFENCVQEEEGSGRWVGKAVTLSY